MQNKLLVVIETDPTFIQKFSKNLTSQFLNDEFQIVQVVPQITEGKPKMLQSCLEELAKYFENNFIAAIFIDINLSEEEKDNTGIELGVKIRGLYNSTPIFSITSKYANDSDFDSFCDASLEDFDGVLIKKYLTSGNFSADRLNIMLTKANEKRKRQSEIFEKIDKEKIDVLIICVIPKEFQALDLVFNFTDKGKKEPYKIFNGIRFWKMQIKQNINSNRELNIVVTMIGTAGNVLSALFSNICYQYFNPSASILCGIAAGNKNKIKIYSAMVADSIVYYELQKYTSDGKIHYRLNSEPGPSLASKDLLYILMRDENWKKSFLHHITKCEILYDDFKNKEWIDENWQNELNLRDGVIASGEKLLADGETISDLANIININKGVVAGEMEGAGFSKASKENSIGNWLIIRGISDYGGDEKSDPINDKYQNLAAIAAASLVEEYLLNVCYIL